jgi:hypothetical protein
VTGIHSEKLTFPGVHGHVRRLLADDLETIEREGEAVVSIAGREFRIRREFLEDLREANTRRAIAELGRALMVFHSPHDTIVTVDNARLIFEAARHPKASSHSTRQTTCSPAQRTRRTSRGSCPRGGPAISEAATDAVS